MINILVTVGTHRFDDLIIALDKYYDPLVNFHFQIGNGGYIPVNYSYERFNDDFPMLLSKFEYVITHAGAGTVYNLLELGKKIIIVPNTQRVDLHQLEISEYVQANNFGLVANTCENLIEMIPELFNYEQKCYSKVDFFKFSEINDFLRLKI